MSTTVNGSQTLPPQILIAASFTATPIEESLNFWISELSLPHRVGFAPYQQIFQTLLSPDSVFVSNERGVNVVLFRLEDLADQAHLADLEAHTNELIDALISASGNLRAPVLVCMCPPSSRFLETEERQKFAARLETQVKTRLADRPRLHLISADNVIARYQVTDVQDPTAERTGHIPYHSAFFTALGTKILRMTLALERKPVKVIAFDCDNTLWTGVCGEDGPLGVKVDSGRRALQEFLVRQKQAGVLLAIASKNNEADVKETFASHPEMVLQWNDVVAHRINWEAKSKNLLELAFELNVGVDSFVFVDDDSKECAEVRSEVPEIATLQIPHRTEDLARFIDHCWIFDRVGAVTAEDRQRTKMYAEQAERSRFEKQAKSLQDFLAGLRLEILFAPVTAETGVRASQLTQRTNQMNAALRRYSVGELQGLLDSGGMEAFTVNVSDRFGDYGLVGLVMFREHDDSVSIDNFLLSCRALGRGVEHRMLAHVGEIAVERGRKFVRVPLTAGPRNQPAIQFFESVAEHAVPDLAAQVVSEAELELPSDVISVLEFPNGQYVSPKEDTSPPGKIQEERKAVDGVDYQQIADRCNTSQCIGEFIQKRRREQQGSSLKFAGTPPQDELQERIARIWCDLLGLESIGIEQDFFDLGGHSLLAVQLLSRIHQELGTDLPDSVIYGDKLRIDNLARTIELQRLGVSDQVTYEAMLAEIESLSDEEVAMLLAAQEEQE